MALDIAVSKAISEGEEPFGVLAILWRGCADEIGQWFWRFLRPHVRQSVVARVRKFYAGEITL